MKSDFAVATARPIGVGSMMAQALSVADLRARARRRLPRCVFDYVDGGAEDERSLRENIEAFEHINFVPKRMVDVSHRSLSRDVLGFVSSAPFVVGPTGLNGLLWPSGDLALARAAKRAGVPFVLSTASNARIEDVAKIGGELWFQLYVVHRNLAEGLVERAKQAGCRVLVLTADVAINGKRERDMRNSFAFPLRYSTRMVLDFATHPRWAWSLLRHGAPVMANLATAGATNLEAQAALLKREMDATFDWEALKRLRERWPGKLVVKGILSASDAARCFALGADAVVISNHGGRQVDSLAAPMDVLPELAGRGDVFIDGGVRRGADVIKAVALGARAVWLGRATLYGLAAAGQAGAFRALEILLDELDRTLALIGCSAVDDLGPEFLRPSRNAKQRGCVSP